jgi:hypothetical protein
MTTLGVGSAGKGCAFEPLAWSAQKAVPVLAEHLAPAKAHWWALAFYEAPYGGDFQGWVMRSGALSLRAADSLPAVKARDSPARAGDRTGGIPVPTV